jgi:hypothetical protein
MDRNPRSGGDPGSNLGAWCTLNLVQETIGPRPTRFRRLAPLGAALIPAGVILSLVGLVGDLLATTLAPAAKRNEELISFSSINPWHLILFAGILLTGAGGIRWAVRQRSEWGGLLGALIALLLVAATALGGWAAVRTPDEPAPRANAPVAPAAVVHHHHNGGAVAGEGEGGAVFGEHSHGKPGPVTAAQRVVLNRQLAAAKSATAKYRDIAVARADGYFQVTQFIPGLGLHMVNLGIPNTTFDPARPQILLYQPQSNGDMRLVGVAYQFQHTNETPPAGFAGGSDVWHYHNDLCFQKGGSVTIAKDDASCKAVGGIAFQQQTSWLLHAWIWSPHPSGVFTEYNPVIT